MFSCQSGTFFYEILDAIGTQWTTTRCGEQDLGAVLSLFLDPGAKHTDGGLCRRCRALLSSFSLASDVRTRQGVRCRIAEGL